MKCIWCDTEVITARIKGETLLVEYGLGIAFDQSHTRERCVERLERGVPLFSHVTLLAAARDVATDVVPAWGETADPVSASKMRALRDALGIKP